MKYRFLYDGLGRLIAREELLADNTPGVYKREHYYYDGVRIIQEVVQEPANGAQSARTWTEREYIYGPDYVDEFVAQIDNPIPDEPNDPYPWPAYMLQDANFNVMALVQHFEAESGQPPWKVLSQYQYEPYGPVAREDHDAGINNSNENVVGHQGLFFHRLSPGNLSLSPTTTGLYYNRNRWYAPHLGRFLTRDPNETASLVVNAMTKNGDALSVLADAFNAQGYYGSGMNLYGYAGSNPIGHFDPLGLYDPFATVDDWTSDRIGNALYTLGQLNEAALGLQTAVSIAGSFLPGSGLYEAFKSVQVIASGKGGFWDAVNIATAAIPLAKGAGKLIGLTSLFKAKRYRWMDCNCFVSGTAVTTPEGSVPIESIREGDEILTRSQDHPEELSKTGRVTRVFRNLAPAILWLTLSTGDVMGTTPGHVVWTYGKGWTSAGQLEAGDALMGRDDRPVTVIQITLDSTPTPVYNVEVEGTWTYFAENVWVHNNSCPAIRSLDRVHGGELHQALGQARIAALKAQGARDIRWHQALVDPSGRKISSLLPDIQYVGPDGKIHIEEIIDSHGGGREDTFRQLLGASFGSYIDVYP